MNMAYSIDIKEKAFSLYCQGYSFDRIIQMLSEENIKLTKRTLCKWQKQYGWSIRRQKVVEQSQKKTDTEMAGKISELAERITDLENSLFEELQNVPLKSKEGGVTALRQLFDMRQRLLADKRFEQHLDEIIGIIFQILAEDEIIGPKLQERQQIIIEKLENRLKEKYGIK